MNDLKIKQLFDYDSWTYTYLLWDEGTKNSIIIDPVFEQSERDLSVIKKLGLNLFIFLKHMFMQIILPVLLI